MTRIGIHFGEGKLEKAVSTLAMANTGLRIPAGADHHAENAHYLFAADSQIVAFSPHMHVRGKAMSYQLTHPDGSKEMLLDVPKYNYGWQWLYYPTKPIDVPAGSRLDVTAVWNNSESNPANPDTDERDHLPWRHLQRDVRRLRRSDRQGGRLERSGLPAATAARPAGAASCRELVPRRRLLQNGVSRSPEGGGVALPFRRVLDHSRRLRVER